MSEGLSPRKGDGIFDHHGARLALDQVLQGKSIPTIVAKAANDKTSCQREGLPKSFCLDEAKSIRIASPPWRLTNLQHSPTPPKRLSKTSPRKSG